MLLAHKHTASSHFKHQKCKKKEVKLSSLTIDAFEFNIDAEVAAQKHENLVLTLLQTAQVLEHLCQRKPIGVLRESPTTVSHPIGFRTILANHFCDKS